MSASKRRRVEHVCQSDRSRLALVGQIIYARGVLDGTGYIAAGSRHRSFPKLLAVRRIVDLYGMRQVIEHASLQDSTRANIFACLRKKGWRACNDGYKKLCETSTDASEFLNKLCAALLEGGLCAGSKTLHMSHAVTFVCAVGVALSHVKSLRNCVGFINHNRPEKLARDNIGGSAIFAGRDWQVIIAYTWTRTAAHNDYLNVQRHCENVILVVGAIGIVENRIALQKAANIRMYLRI